MIKTFLRLVFMSFMFGGWSLAALSLHVIRTPDRIGLIPKGRLGITDTYVDARKWTLDDLQAHPALVKRVLDAGKADLFDYLTNGQTNGHGGTAADQLGSAIGGRAAAPPLDPFRLAQIKGLFAPGQGNSQNADNSSAIRLPLDF